MAIQGILSEDYLAHLRPLLMGEALIACEAVPFEQSDCYRTGKVSSLQDLGLTRKIFGGDSGMQIENLK